VGGSHKVLQVMGQQQFKKEIVAWPYADNKTGLNKSVASILRYWL
jgi:hypothetical protein